MRVRLRDEIKQLQRRLGVTTIMVTHDQEEAMSMADRIVVMNQGVIEQVGTPADIYARPATAFVADFIGHMVFLDGRAAGAGTVTVQGLALQVHDAAAAAAAGTPVRMGLRPEDVQVRGIGADTPNRIETRVISGAYLGSFCRLTLEAVVHPGLALIADLSSNDVRDLDVAVDRTLVVALPPALLRVFPPASGAAR